MAADRAVSGSPKGDGVSKMDQLRALREAKFVTRVTADAPTVTKVPSGKRTGRPRVHATNADRQRAYRARRKAAS